MHKLPTRPLCSAILFSALTLGGGLAFAGAPVKASFEQASEDGAIHADVTRYVLAAPAKFNIAAAPEAAALRRALPHGMFPDVGSGLAFKERNRNGLEFYAITDRGPNSDGPGKAINPTGTGTKIFALPEFHPAFGVIRVTDRAATLVSLTPLVDAAGRKPTGLPPPSERRGAVPEVPLTAGLRFDQSRGAFDPEGLDTEAITVDSRRGVLWASDEYGPYILKLDPKSGRILQWLRPGAGPGDLPQILSSRRANRGFENLAFDPSTGHLVGALQSPIDPLDENGKSLQATPPGGKAVDIKHAARFIRWIDLDPDTGRSRLYAYPVDGSEFEKGRTGVAKLGDVTALGQGRFLVIEQGRQAGDGRMRNWLMLVEIPKDATDISEQGAALEASSITLQPQDGADFSKIVQLRKRKFFDLNAAGWDAEKAEGLALVDAHTIALINDNDFGIRTQLIDAAGTAVEGSVDDCNVDAATGKLFDCEQKAAAGAAVVPTTGAGSQVEFWLIRFDRALTSP